MAVERLLTERGSDAAVAAPAPDRDRLEVVQAFIATSKRQWHISDNATEKLRQRMRADQKFAAGGGNQWDLTDKAIRDDEGRPCLEINRLPQFIRQVSNQQRANRAAIQINPRGKGATAKLAGVLQSVIRSIEVQSDADIAYDTGVEHQLRIGLGYVRLRAAWSPINPFEQDILIDRLRNPLAVYYDPSVQKADFSDARFCHIIAVIGKDEYEARWGKVAPYASLVELVKGDTGMADWMPEGKVFLTEYFYLEAHEETLYRLTSGHELWESEFKDWQAAFQIAYPALPMPGIARQRSVPRQRVRWALHNAIDILEGNEDRTAGRLMPGSRIPIFPVIGDELDLDGEVDYRGMVRDAIDPQRMYNFWASSIAETVGLAPKSPWIAAAGQINQYLEDWQEANRKSHSVLQYDPKTVDGQLVPPPQRNIAEPPIQGMVLGLKEADQDLKAVMGLFEASLGEKGPQQSGKAITAVQQQGVMANSNFLDNLMRTKRAVGRSLMEWIPVIFDTARIMHLVHPDGKKSAAIVHAGAQNAPDATFEQPDDVTEVYDIGVGEYEVTVSTGPSYQTERQETEAWLLDLFKVLPGLAAIGADIVLDNSDNPAAMQLAKRVKQTPQIAQLLEDGDPEAVVPKLRAQLQQQQQQMQQMGQVLQKLAETVKTQKIQADSRVQVAIINAQSQMAAVMAKIGSEQNMAAFQSEYDLLTQAVEHIQTLSQGQADHENTLLQQEQQAQLAPPPAPAGPAPAASAAAA